MKSKSFFWTAATSLLLGLFIGVLLQKNFPMEYLFSKKGVPIPQKGRSEKGIPGPRMDDTEIPQEAAGKINLFILAGQSNMVGYGKIDPREIEVSPKILVFGNDYRWKLAREPIDDPAGQVDRVSLDIEAGYSCGTAFAERFLKYDSKGFIGLIPCAKNGSSISEWQRNLSDNSLYGSCLKRALAASAMGRIRGLLFFQGESDALDPAIEPQKVKTPFQWGERFSRFVFNLRKDLRQPDLPIVFAQIGAHQDARSFKNWRAVQEEQSKISLPNCRMIKTDDLTLNDPIHFDNRSYRIIGERFALAMLEIISGRGAKGLQRTLSTLSN